MKKKTKPQARPGSAGRLHAFFWLTAGLLLLLGLGVWLLYLGLTTKPFSLPFPASI